MALPGIRSDTGSTVLPDIGTLSYNGVTWSHLYKSKVEGPPSPDDANRTTKCVDYTLTIEGVVTLNAGDANTDATWQNLRKRLSVPGGTLVYTGNGFGSLIVNQPGNPVRDVAWGPVPKELDFQPLGQARAAFMKWQVKTRIPELKNTTTFRPQIGPPGTGLSQNPNAVEPSFPGDKGRFFIPVGARLNNQNPQLPLSVLQYNYEASLTYDDQDYSGYSIRGTLEIPLTRRTVDDRTLSDIVTNYRQTWLDIQCDLDNFKVVRRHFNVSRDKRTIDWEFVAEELAPMGLPPGATDADGTFSVRNSGKAKMALCNWTCSLQASYVIRKDKPPRLAAEAFYALLWFRIQSSRNTPPQIRINNSANAQQQPSNWPEVLKPSNQKGSVLSGIVSQLLGGAPVPGSAAAAQLQQQPIGGLAAVGGQLAQKPTGGLSETGPSPGNTNVIVYDFGFDEGLYKSSKRITFHCTWALLGVPWTSLLTATGVWRWLNGSSGGNQWALSVQDIQGWRSWMTNNLDPTMDVIVDLGGGNPPQASPIAS